MANYELNNLTLQQKVGEEFEAAWRRWDGGTGARPRLEQFVNSLPCQERAGVLVHLVLIDMERRRVLEETPQLDEYEARFPDYCELLRRHCGSASAGQPRQPPPLKLDDYEILEEIKTGGMGRVVIARQKSLDRRVALKFLGRADYEGERRFQREARFLAGLDHPNIVKIHGIGKSNEDEYFLVLEYVEGDDLEEFQKKEGRLDAKDAARIVAAIASAIHHAHQRGVIHRDLKPANVLRDANGVIKVTDFGLAKALASNSTALSAPAQVMGTPLYMAPEQASASWGEVSERTDIYGLGAVLYNLLTGAHPFDGDSLDEILAKVRAESGPTPPRSRRPDVSPALEMICLRCLSKNPAERYESAARVQADLEAFLSGQLTGQTEEPIILTVLGAAGGVGKSTLACRIAEMIAETGSRVVVIDLDCAAAGSTSLHMDRGSRSFDCTSTSELILEYARNPGGAPKPGRLADVSPAYLSMHHTSDAGKVFLLPAYSRRTQGSASITEAMRGLRVADVFHYILDAVRRNEKVDCILIDCGAAGPQYDSLTTQAHRESCLTYIVVEPDAKCRRSITRLNQLLTQETGPALSGKIRVIINKLNDRRHESAARSQFDEFEIAACIPFNKQLFDDVQKGRVNSDFGYDDISCELRKALVHKNDLPARMAPDEMGMWVRRAARTILHRGPAALLQGAVTRKKAMLWSAAALLGVLLLAFTAPGFVQVVGATMRADETSPDIHFLLVGRLVVLILGLLGLTYGAWSLAYWARPYLFVRELERLWEQEALDRQKEIEGKLRQVAQRDPNSTLLEWLRLAVK